MLEQTVTVTLPIPVFRRLKRAAELSYRSVDDVLVSTINAAFMAPTTLPDALADELATMHLLSDDALWSAVHPSLSSAQIHRLHQLNHKAGEQNLSAAEELEHQALLDAYHHSNLRRAQALAILAQRGHPIEKERLGAIAIDVEHENF
jgi:hypothetical protein